MKHYPDVKTAGGCKLTLVNGNLKKIILKTAIKHRYPI